MPRHWYVPCSPRCMLLRTCTVWTALALLSGCSGSAAGEAAIPIAIDGVYSLPNGACASFDTTTSAYEFWSHGWACDPASGSVPPSKAGPYSFDAATGLLSLTDSASGAVYSATLHVVSTSPLSTSADEGLDLLGTSLTGPSSTLTSGSGSLTSGSGAALVTKTITLLRADDADATPLTGSQGNLTPSGTIQLLRANGL
jgi:hypothetical protein